MRRHLLFALAASAPALIYLSGKTGYVGTLRSISALNLYGVALLAGLAVWTLRAARRRDYRRPALVALAVLLLFCEGVGTAAVSAQQFTTFTPHCPAADDTAEFQAVISTVGSRTTSIQVPWFRTDRCTVNSLTVPSNVALDFSVSTGLAVNTGQTLTVRGGVFGPEGQQFFYNALSGQGTVSFAGNKVLSTVPAQWWGAQFDSSSSGGGTDDTLPIRAALAAGATMGRMRLPVPGVALVSGLDVSSNTTIDGAQGSGFYLKSGSNRAAIKNAHQTSGNLASIVDEGITLRNITVYGNRDGQNIKCLPAGVTIADADCISGGVYVVGVQMFGVRGLVFDRLHIYAAKNFSFHGANLDGWTVTDSLAEQPDFTVDNHDGWHVNGPARNLRGDVRCKRTTDDCAALNSFDPVGIFGGVVNGPITNVVLDVTGDECFYGFRGMGNSSTTYLDDVTVKLHGKFQELAAHFDDGRQYGGTGAGDIRRVTLDLNVGGAVFDAGYSIAANQEAVGVYSKVDQLNLSVAQNQDWWPDYRAALRVRSAVTTPADWPWCHSCTGGLGDIRELNMRLQVIDPAGTDPTGGGSSRASSRIVNEGSITRALVDANLWRDASVAQSKGLYWNKGGSTGELILSGGANRLFNTVALTSGSMTYVRFSPWSDSQNGGAVMFAQQSGGTITAYPAVSGDLFATSSTPLGGPDVGNVGTYQFCVGGVCYTQPTTYAGLPSSPREGAARWITDSTTNTWGATVSGGGANKVLAVWNGSNWTVTSK